MTMLMVQGTVKRADVPYIYMTYQLQGLLVWWELGPVQPGERSPCRPPSLHSWEYLDTKMKELCQLSNHPINHKPTINNYKSSTKCNCETRNFYLNQILEFLER